MRSGAAVHLTSAEDLLDLKGADLLSLPGSNIFVEKAGVAMSHIGSGVGVER